MICPFVSTYSANLAVPVSQVKSGDMEMEKRLRKDLKRTKALLADAHVMLDHIKNNAPSKREIAQLKNQVQLLKYHIMLTPITSITHVV